MPMYLLCNGKRSAIKPYTPPRQVAVSGSGVLAQPTSSLQQMVPAGNNLQKATALKHPAGMSSWDVQQGLTSAWDLQSSSEGRYPQQTLQVQHSRANDSSSEMRRTGELLDWRSALTTKQPLFQTAAGRPVQLSASAMVRAHPLLGE
ncbi:unnamed protein product [Sphagnum jensenii]|uniref:Uncharacterized protein n=1 Tax=Sphagnum jensenii TaxID=128206 RepID=A0ABP0WP93_9BRYO